MFKPSVDVVIHDRVLSHHFVPGPTLIPDGVSSRHLGFQHGAPDPE